ncbi:MAG: 23S rRNA (uracil(1939)-C(5))-methyltransferase RlmD [Rhodospirillaceae bacterium]|nr:23S rRNA (uracil(1939)-C(5))-methyltransferase RlmD [Rhodospirillaceae bacterium]
MSATPHIEIDIIELGSRGDGIGYYNGLTVFVPYTIPGDRVLVCIDEHKSDRLSGKFLQLLNASSIRVESVCRHFGKCGGCGLQHLDDVVYKKWKHELLINALHRIGFYENVVMPMISVVPGNRRRAIFTFQRQNFKVLIGFYARASNQIIDIIECQLFDKSLIDLLEPLRALLIKLINNELRGRVIVTATEFGLDVIIEGEAQLNLSNRNLLTIFAEDTNLARLSWRWSISKIIELIIHRCDVLVNFSGIMVDLPPGAFLQPSIEGERILVSLIINATGSVDAIADLFAGCGSFTFPLANNKVFVHAVDKNVSAIMALKSAAKHNNVSRVSVECRDLSRRPLLFNELKYFNAVVLDPPRIGAVKQVEQLIKTDISLIVVVSCNPVTFARDAKILVDGGYNLTYATPIDQFPWSYHLEIVAIFER